MPSRGTGRDTVVDPFGAAHDDLGVHSSSALIEIVFDRETLERDADRVDRPTQAALHIWSKNRIYKIDSAMNCFEVRNRKSGEIESHQVVGARLGGGQRRYRKTLHISRPFPVPGTEAVFQRGGKVVGVTSKVERVVLHILLTTVVANEPQAWDDVTGAFLMPETSSHRASRKK